MEIIAGRDRRCQEGGVKGKAQEGKPARATAALMSAMVSGIPPMYMVARPVLCA